MKRHLPACDADYDVSSDPSAHQTKRQKLLESDGKLHVITGFVQTLEQVQVLLIRKKFIVKHCVQFVTSWVNSDFRNI